MQSDQIEVDNSHGRTVPIDINVNLSDRSRALIGGAALTAFGITFGVVRRHILGLALALVGGTMIRTGLTGKSLLYQATGINHAVPNIQEDESSESEAARVHASTYSGV